MKTRNKILFAIYMAFMLIAPLATVWLGIRLGSGNLSIDSYDHDCADSEDAGMGTFAITITIASLLFGALSLCYLYLADRCAYGNLGKHTFWMIKWILLVCIAILLVANMLMLYKELMIWVHNERVSISRPRLWWQVLYTTLTLVYGQAVYFHVKLLRFWKPIKRYGSPQTKVKTQCPA